ncbi:transcriptional regulator [Paenibacillus sp. 598K]|uniref:helix-turn-helix domain-containing protein n=1 Tax=Paenibacillus sp. 598K TaxID=1117987 RepID=UPI000FFA90BD|nr:helix-turn-helix transcriptional regulator [Paenibacillus sp. 598K]GBF73425.1 transcriptional regulator [Paenibacillus sp. 598K]
MNPVVNYFDHKQTIAKNLHNFLVEEGYSKRSFSTLTGISRPTIDLILKGESPSPTTFNAQILKINEILQLSPEQLIEVPRTFNNTQKVQKPAYSYSDHGIDEEKNERAQDLLNGLDNVLDIYSMYV